MGQIYCIYNDINNKEYVGQTRHTAEERFKEHIYGRTREDRNKTCPLYLAMNKYGVEHFSVRILEECDDSLLNERESYWIEKLNSYYNGYNATFGGGCNGAKNDYKEIVEVFKTEGKFNQHITSEICKVSRAVVRKALESQDEQTDYCHIYDYDIIVQKYLELVNVTKTAQFFNCDKSVVRNACERYNIEIKKPKTGGRKKPVVQFDISTNKILKIFDSVTEAAKAVNGDTSLISGCCKHNPHCLTAYGYKWEYYESRKE